MIKLFCDGSCKPNPGIGGAACVFVRDDKKIHSVKKYLGQGTNSIAELEAVNIGLNYLHDRDEEIKIYTDSQYTIKILSAEWKAYSNKKLVLEIKELLSYFKNVEFIWVKAHNGNEFNEAADKLAKKAGAQGEYFDDLDEFLDEQGILEKVNKITKE